MVNWPMKPAVPVTKIRIFGCEVFDGVWTNDGLSRGECASRVGSANKSARP